MDMVQHNNYIDFGTAMVPGNLYLQIALIKNVFLRIMQIQ